MNSVANKISEILKPILETANSILNKKMLQIKTADLGGSLGHTGVGWQIIRLYGTA
jgi:hypothetical protein